ncbi:MAG: selenocysteine-specific translation elongation factor [Candidatus Marinimicrobia bacterium]|nr:selenocysteine-specific translation elongation factor [Candidatus Neomarinimicrobiota bacterium]
MNSIIIGTAGHVDHGKTTLIKNLTGIDTDRLKEEKERELTIDIGFAFLGENISFIDVPGHEKFIKNMVAGAATINFFMLVIAADDGIMPQTLEHFEIMKFLGLERGMIVLTKIDLVDEKTRIKRKEEIKKYFENSILHDSPLFEVTKENDSGIDQLRNYLLGLISGPGQSLDSRPFRMPIDRFFSMKGFGTIITGTVISGQLSENASNLVVYPEEIPIKIRNLESQNRNVNHIHANQRCALNLQSLKKHQFYRGQIITEKNLCKPAATITCLIRSIDSPPPVHYGETIKFHTHTLETKATIRMIGYNKLVAHQDMIVQLDFENPIAVWSRDRFIIRKLSPARIVGGGVVLDIHTPRIKKSAIQYMQKFLNLNSDDLKSCLKYLLELYPCLSIKNLTVKYLQYPEVIVSLVLEEKSLVMLDKYVFSSTYLNSLKDKILQSVIEAADEGTGLEKTQLYKEAEINKKIIDLIIEAMCMDNILVCKEGKIYSKEKSTSYMDDKIIQIIENQILEQGYKLLNYSDLQALVKIEKKDFQKGIDYLKFTNQIITLDKGYLLHDRQACQAREVLIEYLKTKERATVTEFKAILQTSRRFIIPILNYFDRTGLFKRDGIFRSLT